MGSWLLHSLDRELVDVQCAKYVGRLSERLTIVSSHAGQRRGDAV
jgi:hypothetical protein